MLTVVFLETTDEGQREAGRVHWTKARGVWFEDVSDREIGFLQEGIYADMKKLTPKDGAAFVRGLPEQYSGDYLRAKIEEDS
tara:strand:- start:32920 stop:33165 length:246 start_codon:yes stop_codon:yes gene_type:complete